LNRVDPKLSIRQWAGGFFAGGAAIALILAIAFSSFGSGQAKWKFARAKILAGSGETEQAISLMEEALVQLPGNAEIKFSLAHLLAENGQGELAIGHCDELLDADPNNVTALGHRSLCLQSLGRFDESLADYKASLAGHVSRTPTELNHLAYFRGLANKELDKAASEVQLAIDEIEKRPDGFAYSFSMHDKATIAAGLISRHIGHQEEVLGALNLKIKQYERFNERNSALLRRRITLEVQRSFPIEEQVESELLNVRANLEVQRQMLGLLYVTRALAYEDLGCCKNADADRVKLGQLGLEFDKIALGLPADEMCLRVLGSANYLLDTRGFISGLRDWKSASELEAITLAIQAGELAMPTVLPGSYQLALEDLNLAVLSARYSQLALNTSLYNNPEHSAARMEGKKRMARRMTAVLVYHRMNVHLKAGNQCAADEDRRRIIELGFCPDSSLF
jgi:tetratricopeptide (TPR) repeat protein